MIEKRPIANLIGHLMLIIGIIIVSRALCVRRDDD